VQPCFCHSAFLPIATAPVILLFFQVYNGLVFAGAQLLAIKLMTLLSYCPCGKLQNRDLYWMWKTSVQSSAVSYKDISVQLSMGQATKPQPPRLDHLTLWVSKIQVFVYLLQCRFEMLIMPHKYKRYKWKSYIQQMHDLYMAGEYITTICKEIQNPLDGFTPW
jgi:hypothetical protein